MTRDAKHYDSGPVDFFSKKKQFFLNAQILFLRAGFMTCWDVSAVFSPRIGDTKRQKN